MRATDKMNHMPKFGAKPDAIVIAACETVEEAHAILQYALPVLQEWPQPAWSAWITDSADCLNARAAAIRSDEDNLRWQPVDTSEFLGNKVVCDVLGGKSGIVVLAHQTIARKLLATFGGLVGDLHCLSMSDAAAKAFKRPFADFGVMAAV
jgi:hypothetical protein